MKTWRVGTFSMGASLIGLGIFLFISRALRMDVSTMMAAWWPLIFIILGTEILVYLGLNKKTGSPLKYDLLSIFLVGILGFAGVAMTALDSIGLLEKIERAVAAEFKTEDLPVFNEPVKDIERIVIETTNPIHIESTRERKVVAFGTVRTKAGKDRKTIDQAEEYIQTQKTGDTLYIKLKELPYNQYEYPGQLDVMFLVPYDVKLEVMGNQQEITLRTRTLMSDWHVNEASKLQVVTSPRNNLTIVAENISEVNSEDPSWEMESVREEGIRVTEERYPSDNGRIKRASYKIGEGKYEILVTYTGYVEVLEGK